MAEKDREEKVGKEGEGEEGKDEQKTDYLSPIYTLEEHCVWHVLFEMCLIAKSNHKRISLLKHYISCQWFT